MSITVMVHFKCDSRLELGSRDHTRCSEEGIALCPMTEEGLVKIELRETCRDWRTHKKWGEDLVQCPKCFLREGEP